MSSENTDNPLGYERIPLLLKQFTIPSIIAMLVSSLYNVVDQIFIGQGVGYLGNAATNVAFPITTICMAIALTIGIGCASRFSLYLGNKEEEEASKVVGNGFCMMLVFGIAYAILVEIFLIPLLNAFGATQDIFSYAVTYTRITTLGMPFLVIMNGLSHLARSDGNPSFSMTTMLIGAIINTILDPIFIFVFHWGVAGAAWATILGQVASCIMALSYLRQFKRVTIRKEYFRLSSSQMISTAKMGMSSGLTQIAITFVQVILNRSLVHYGSLSVYGPSIPLASSGIVLKINGIVFAVLIGLMQGMQPIIGFNYGAKQYKRVKSTYYLVVGCELVITLLGVFIFETFPEKVLSLFGKGDELYMEFSVRFMRTFLILFPLGGVHMISSNLFSAIGKPVRGAFLSLTRQVFFFIPLVLILPLFFGLNGTMFAGPVSDFAACTMVLFFVVKEIREMK